MKTNFIIILSIIIAIIAVIMIVKRIKKGNGTGDDSGGGTGDGSGGGTGDGSGGGTGDGSGGGEKNILEPEFADYILSMKDIVSYFRTLGLKQGEDIPFVSSLGKKNKFTSLIKGIEIPDIPTDKKAILLGVYNEKKGKLKNLKIIFALDLDGHIKSILSSEGYAILK